MEASSSKLSKLAQLLWLVATTLPPEIHVFILRDLPVRQLARLACVHKAFLVAWRSLQEQCPGGCYDPPFSWKRNRSLLASAATCGNAERITSIVQMCRAQLMEEFGGKSKGQRRQRQALLMKRLASKDAMQLAAGHGHLEAVKALAKVNVLEGEVLPGGKAALLSASLHGHADVLEYLILRGAGVHARGDAAMRRASQVKVLVAALHSASQEGHTDVVKLLIQHGADVHARDEQALRWASANGHVNVVELLIQHDADVHACNDAALRSASAKGHADVVQLLMQHGARMPSS